MNPFKRFVANALPILLVPYGLTALWLWAIINQGLPAFSFLAGVMIVSLNFMFGLFVRECCDEYDAWLRKELWNDIARAERIIASSYGTNSTGPGANSNSGADYMP